MGVPGLFAWLRRKYPQIIDESAKTSGSDNDEGDDRTCHNLYIDMNHIIHACSHPRWRASGYATEQEIFFNIQEYLERLVAVCRPQRLLMIAIDGVAPQAKMCQQRTRRFMSAHVEQIRKKTEMEVRREMMAQASGVVIPRILSFDGNIITPGTPFMANLAKHLRQYLQQKATTDPAWQHLQVLLSDSSEPGEGEHKIMRFVRHQRTCPEYDPNSHHVIFGQDADLILLALLTHEPHFSILREAGNLEDYAKDMGLESKDISAGKHQPLQFLEISTLREYLRFEFQELVGPAPEPPEEPPASPPDEWSAKPQDPDSHLWNDAPKKDFSQNEFSQSAFSTDSGDFDFERVLQDFILLTFLSGNDFLPSIPSLEIYGRPSGLDILLKTYKEQLPELGGPITNGVAIDPDRLKRMLTKLAEDEEDSFKRASMRKARDSQRQAEKENDASQGGAGGFKGPDGSGQWVSLGELDPNEDLDQALNSLTGDGNVQNGGIDLFHATPDELTMELSRRVSKRVDDILKGGADADPIRLGLSGHRARLYEIRFKATAGEGVEKMARKVSHAYVQGLTWVLTYYIHGNTPVPITTAHMDALTEAQERLQGKGNNASDSSEGLGAAWDWYYPYHYAPLISDLAKNATGGKKTKGIIAREIMSTTDDSWAPSHGPVRPLVQLMAVLPPESARFCLPLKLALIIEGSRSKNGLEQTSMAAALGDMFPADLGPLIDMSGKVYAHTAVVQLPFANVQRLAAAAQEADPNEWKFKPDEEDRNEVKVGSMITNKAHPCSAAVDLIAQRGLSWPQAKLNLLARRHPRWHPGEGRYSLSVMRLLVPTSSPDAPPIGEDQPGDTVSVDIDIAGVPTPPFAASLLSGCILPPAVVTERVWEKEQRKKMQAFATSAMAGKGKWGGGGSKAGQGIPAGRGGKYAQPAGSKAPVLVVPRGIPVNRNAQTRPTQAPLGPSRAANGAAGGARPIKAPSDSGVPDWGEDDDTKGNSKKSDTEIARELQNMFNSELQGPGHISLDDADELLAKKLQAQADREFVRNNKPKGRSAKQVKADEDFARRMQQQEKELANFRVLEYQEMLRRRKAVEDMGGVAEQTTMAPNSSDFPQLSESVPAQPAKPVWPRVAKPVARKKPASASGWGTASAAGSQSGMSDRASEGWDEGPNWVPTYNQPAAGASQQAAPSNRQSTRGTAWDADGWGAESANGSGHHDSVPAQANMQRPQQQHQESNRGRSWSRQSASNSGWEDSDAQQPSRSVYDDYPQASSNNYAQQSNQQQNSSFGNVSASGYGAAPQAGGNKGGGYKERAAAAARQNARENADKERRDELELQRQTEAAERRHNSMPTDGYADYNQPAAQSYQTPASNMSQQYQSSGPPPSSHQSQYPTQSAYPAQPAYPPQPQYHSQTNYQPQQQTQPYQTPVAQQQTAVQSQPAAKTPAASQTFDIDAWLADMNIGAPSAAAPKTSQGQQNGGFASPQQEIKYLPPQRRSPPKDDVSDGHSNGGAGRPPPGFGW